MTAPALAHHGWSWTEDGFFQLEGTIAGIDLGNPHDMLDVEVDGEVWRVELAPPAATARSGSRNGVRQGRRDRVTAIGNRSQDSNERRMKAVRIMVNGQTFDVYPSRVPTN
jgi:hypothetical protein